MSVSVSIKVRREIAELADKMVKYGLARSRNHAFNVLIEGGGEFGAYKKLLNRYVENEKRHPLMKSTPHIQLLFVCGIG